MNFYIFCFLFYRGINLCVYVIALVIFNYNMRGTNLICPQPTQFEPPLFKFLVGLLFVTHYPLSSSVTTLISKDTEFYCASLDVCENFVGGCPPTQTPTQKLKN